MQANLEAYRRSIISQIFYFNNLQFAVRFAIFKNALDVLIYFIYLQC